VDVGCASTEDLRQGEAQTNNQNISNDSERDLVRFERGLEGAEEELAGGDPARAPVPAGRLDVPAGPEVTAAGILNDIQYLAATESALR